MSVHWAISPVRGHLVVQGQVYVYEEVQVSELRMDYGH